jgi:hypothetical protein
VPVVESGQGDQGGYVDGIEDVLVLLQPQRGLHGRVGAACSLQVERSAVYKLEECGLQLRGMRFTSYEECGLQLERNAVYKLRGMRFISRGGQVAKGYKRRLEELSQL